MNQLALYGYFTGAAFAFALIPFLLDPMDGDVAKLHAGAFAFAGLSVVALLGLT